MEDFFIEYLKICRDFIGSANNPLLYQSGERTARTLKATGLEEIKNEMQKRGFDFTYAKTRRYLIFTVTDSIETRAVEKTDRPCCHMLRGFFAEIAKTHMNQQNMRCTETKCRGKGDEVCEFRVELKT